MCTVCGCGEGETRLETHDHAHAHEHGDGHGHDHTHGVDGELHYGHGPAHAHAPGLSQARMVQIERDILSKNDEYAAANRARFTEQGTLTLNLVSSPGSGKTTLLVETLKRLHGRYPLGVIEGDQQTSNDATRIRVTGTPAIQINTGKGCHLDAHMVGHALDHFVSLTQGVLFIENVGNLVCPAGFDLGEAHKVIILSAAEGEDKPIKYPDMFHAADLLLLNKIDLLPYVHFNVDKCVEYVRRINPDIRIVQLSAQSGEGLDDWLGWIEAERIATLDRELA